MADNPFPKSRPLAVVTGASSGIGYELARCCADHGYDLLVAADEPEIEQAAERLRAGGRTVRALQCDLSGPEGVEQLCAALAGQPVEALLANAGRGLGKGFLDQDFASARHVVDTNITGTIALVQRIGRDMRERRRGRILITGSIAGFMPGSYQAVYNASKAFLDSFAYALANELKDSGVSVTCLMPGVTDTRFFERADLLDTKVGAGKKADPALVARHGFDAMLQGRPGVVSGMKNKLQVAMAHVTPTPLLAEQHRKMAAPGTAHGKAPRGEPHGTPRRPGAGRALLAGALGGLVGGVVVSGLLLLQAARTPRRPSELALLQRRAAGQLGLAHRMLPLPSTRAEEAASHGWHLALSVALGAAYALTLGRTRLPAAASGTAFGLGFYPLAYGLAGPALGLTPKLRDDSAGSIARHAAVHGVFGLATGLATEQAAKRLARH